MTVRADGFGPPMCWQLYAELMKCLKAQGNEEQAGEVERHDLVLLVTRQIGHAYYWWQIGHTRVCYF